MSVGSTSSDGAGAKSAYSLSGTGEHESERLRRQAAITLAQELPELLRSLPPGGRFLDLGAGLGTLADAVAGARPDVRVWGLDIDPQATATAAQTFGDRPNLKFECRDLAQAPPSGFEPVDAAYLRLVLMHVPHPVQALEQARRWIRPNGILHLLETDDRRIELLPRPDWLDDLLDLMQAVQLGKGGNRHLGGELELLAKKAGLKVLGRREIVPESGATLAAFPKVFLPVGEYYLAEAKRTGNIPFTRLEHLEKGIFALKSGHLSLEMASVPLFHVWVGVS